MKFLNCVKYGRKLRVLSKNEILRYLSSQRQQSKDQLEDQEQGEQENFLISLIFFC